MSLESRFEKFQKVFPKAKHTFEEWKKITSWNESWPTLIRLDTSIFPDGLKKLVWESAPVNTVIFCPTQTKLTLISLADTNVNKVLLPEQYTKVETLILANSPVTKLGLGGSAGSLKELILPTEMPVNRFRLPAGMEKLAKLTVGTVEGPITLPKDATALQEVFIKSCDERRRVKIPAEWTKLNHLTVMGNVDAILISNVITTIETLIVETWRDKLQLPRIDGVKTLSIRAGELEQDLTVPNSMGPTLENVTLHVGLCSGLNMPKSMPNLKKLCIHGEKVTKITVPKDSADLNILDVQCQELVVNPELSVLGTLWSTAETVKIPHVQTAMALETIFMPEVKELKAKFPKEIPTLRSISVPGDIGLNDLIGSSELVRSIKF